MELLLQEILNGLVVGSTYAVVAVGFALIFIVMRVVNLAHPELLSIAMYLLAVLNVLLASLSIWALALAVIIGVIVIALGIERFVLRPLRNRSVLMPLIATAGVSLLIENVLAAWFGIDPINTPTLVPERQLSFGPLYLGLPQAATICAAVVMAGFVSLYVRRTSWGRAIRAVAERPDVAAAFGIDVNRVSQITVGLASFLAAVAGLLLSSQYHSTNPFLAAPFTLKAFICMLVSGNRYLEAVVVTGLLLGVSEVLVATYVSSSLGDAVAFIVLVAVLLIRPRGLFGSYDEGLR